MNSNFGRSGGGRKHMARAHYREAGRFLYDRRGLFTLEVAGGQRHTRSDAIRVFHTRGKGGLVDGRGARPIILGPQ